MRRVAGTALTVTSMFLGLVAVLIDAPALFYMSFALIATLVACSIQSKLATRALRIERIAPHSVRVGELVVVEIVLWSERKIQRPLVTVRDRIPEILTGGQLGPSLPVAPAFDLPVRTMYKFRALKRGQFGWRVVDVTATDALGLTTRTVQHQTDPTDIVVIPTPIPVSLDLPSSTGWGVNEAVSGQAAGSGLELRGIRPYSYGDSLRHVHWRTSARTGVLQVKEFQAGSQGAASFILQRDLGTDCGKGSFTTLDAMCGHAMYLIERFMRQGLQISVPNLDGGSTNKLDFDAQDEVGLMLGKLQADRIESVATELAAAAAASESGTTFYVMVAIHDKELPAVIQLLRGRNTIVVLAYNATTFDHSKSLNSASEYIEYYRESGALVSLMPEVSL